MGVHVLLNSIDRIVFIVRILAISFAGAKAVEAWASLAVFWLEPRNFRPGLGLDLAWARAWLGGLGDAKRNPSRPKRSI